MTAYKKQFIEYVNCDWGEGIDDLPKTLAAV